VDQHRQSGTAFHEGADRAGVVLPDDQVAFPMANFPTVVDLSRALPDVDHAGIGSRVVSVLNPLSDILGCRISPDGTPRNEREGTGGDRHKVVCIGCRYRQEWTIKKPDLCQHLHACMPRVLMHMRVGDIAGNRGRSPKMFDYSRLRDSK
jgi:hypothetical protein